MTAIQALGHYVTTKSTVEIYFCGFSTSSASLDLNHDTQTDITTTGDGNLLAP